MGCTSSKATQTVETVEVADAPSGKGHQKDTAMLMCPYFKVAPDQREAFSASCDAFYQSAVESEGVLFYGTAQNDEGVHVRQGYRSAEAMVSHLQQTEVHMSRTLETAQLERVEVHGTRKQIATVRRHTTKIGSTDMQFFETHPKIHSVRRPTAFAGQMGSDKLVSVHVSLQVSTVAEMRTLEPRVKCVHRRACGLAANESFFFSRCVERGMVKIVATFATMEAGMEHLACMVAHLGQDSLRWLELHGPEWELAKVKELLGKVGAAAGAVAGTAEAALAAAAKRAAEDALQAKACAEAAGRACTRKVGEGFRAARDKTAQGLKAVQSKAQDMANQVYLDAVKVEGVTEEVAKATANAAYKRAMEAVNDIRQAADHAAKLAYDDAIAVGKSVEKAMQAADAAAHAAAKAAHDELKVLADDAEAALNKAEQLGEAGVKAAAGELAAIKLSVEIGALEVERLMSEAAKAVRRALMSFYGAVKGDAIAACEATYKTAVAAGEATEEAARAAGEKAKAAAFAVASAGEHVYLVAYDKALRAGKAAAEAGDAAAKAAECAAGKTLDIWRQAEELCASALKAAQNMLLRGARTLATALRRAVTWVLDVAKAVRKSLVMGACKAAVLLKEGMLDFAWAVGAVVDGATDALESAAGLVADASRSAMHHFDHALTMIPHFEVPAEHRESFRKACTGFQKVSVESSDALFYGVSFKEGGACIRHGYRSASAMVSHVRESEMVMTEATKYGKLRSVEVHGTRRQLVKVRKQVSKVSSVSIDFYETDKKIRAIRRPTEFSGKAGSDSMVTAHLSVSPAESQHKAISHKVKAVHKAASDHPGVQQFSISRCINTGALKIIGTFTSVEAGMEHLSVAAMHLGTDVLHSLEMHGPSSELDKIKGLLGAAAGAASDAAASCAGVVKGALAAAEKRAEDDLAEATALAEAAEKAVALVATDAVKSAREKAAGTIAYMHTAAEDMAQELYQDMVQAEKGTEDYLKDLSKQSYKAAMDAYSEIRQAAEEDARKAYERAIAAGASAEQALEEAHKAADAAASAMKEELTDLADAAEADLASARDGVKKKMEAKAVTSQAAAQFAGKGVAAVASPASKEARSTMLGMHAMLKANSTQVVSMHYQKAVHSEERICMVGERARAASWSVAVAHEEAYMVSYARAVVAGKSGQEALAAGREGGAASVDKVLSVWKQAAAYSAEALDIARALAAQEQAAMVGLWSYSIGYAVDVQTSLRHSLYSGVVLAGEELHEATEGVAWAVSAAVEGAFECAATDVKGVRIATETEMEGNKKGMLCCH